MFRQAVQNLSFRKKIQLIILSCVVIIASTALIGIYWINKTNKEVLYRSVYTTLSYSASKIHDDLTEAENLAMIILSDSTIQETLPFFVDSKTGAGRSNNETDIYNTLNNYLINVSGKHISYLAVLLEDSYICTDIFGVRNIPGDIQDRLREIGHAHHGSSVWVSDYCQDYGLFLVKELRESKNLSLRPLGTLLIHIDLDQLIAQATSFDSDYETPNYLLAAGENLIYPKEEDLFPEAAALKDQLKEGYDIYTVGGNSVFAVHGLIPGVGWDYICTVSYESIAHTLSVSLRICLLSILAAILCVLISSSQILEAIIWHLDWLVYKMNKFGDDNYTLADNGYDYSQRKDLVGKLHTNFDAMALKIRTLIQDNYVNELLKKEAQLKALENQMDPHFLYNTLDSINWRAKAIRADDISRITTALGNLLRTSLSKNSYPFSIRQEIDMVENYMMIQKLRYPRRLEYSIDIPSEFWDYEIPKFTIQPLLENAIRYGLEEISEICSISVAAFSSDDDIIIEVKNNGSQFEKNLLKNLEEQRTQPHGFGIGLLNIHQRLNIAYGASYGLYLYNIEDELTGEEYAVARITLPRVPLVREGA